MCPICELSALSWLQSDALRDCKGIRHFLNLLFLKICLKSHHFKIEECTTEKLAEKFSQSTIAILNRRGISHRIFVVAPVFVPVNGNLPVDKGRVLTHSLALHCLSSWISAVQGRLPRSTATRSGFDFQMGLYFGLQQESLSFCCQGAWGDSSGGFSSVKLILQG